MFAVTVRHHIMIAHSLPRDYFGPAARLHGATYVIDAEFRSPTLNEHSVVIDIGEAQRVVQQVAGELEYRNLDEVPALAGVLTTTEFLARYLHQHIARALRAFHGSLKITLHESHVASASYDAEIAR